MIGKGWFLVMRLNKITHWCRDDTNFTCKIDDRSWCSVRDGESQLQDHHVSQTIKHASGAIFVWGRMTSRGMDYVCKIEGRMTQALYLTILQDGVMKTIE